MQLASPGKETDQKLSLTIHAALIDSLFQTASTMLAGSLCNAFAAMMTAPWPRWNVSPKPDWAQ